MDTRFANLIALLTIALMGLVACASGPAVENEEAQSYIVQARDLETAIQAVRSVGGVITHELGIIRAVGAELTPSQAEQLRAMEGMKINENPKVELAAMDPIAGAADLEFNGKKVMWDLTNLGGGVVTISRITASWPLANSFVKKIKLDGDEFYNLPTSPPSAVIDSGWKNDEVDRQLSTGSTETLEIEFDEDVITDPTQYGFTIEFSDGSSVSFTAGFSFVCPPLTVRALDISDDKIKWEIHNTCEHTIILDSLTLVWPPAYGGVTEIKIAGSTIVSTVQPAPSVTTTAADWQKPPWECSIGSYDSETIEIKFADKADVAEFYLKAGFAGTSSVEYNDP